MKMKKLVVFLAFVVVGTQAAKVETCRQKIKRACGNGSYSWQLINIADRMTDGDQCNVIQSELREGTANDRVPERVVFKDSQKLISVVTGNEGPGEAPLCSYRVVDLKGSFVESKINSGRMFAVTSTGHVAVITRTNTVQWLVNTERGANQGTRFYNVVDIKIDSKNDRVYLTYKNGKTEVVSLSEVLTGLNKYKQCTSGGC